MAAEDKASYISLISLRDRVTSQLIVLLTVILWILFVITIWRTRVVGIQPAFWTNIFLLIIMSIVFLLRRRISPRLSSAVILAVLYVIFVVGELTYGLFSAAFIIAPLISFYLLLVTNRMIAGLSTVVNVVFLALAGYLFTAGILVIPTNVDIYLRSPLPWVFVIAGVAGTSVSYLVPFAEVPEALQESEERFRLAFENANVGVCLTGLDGRLLKVNRALGEMLGYSVDKLESLSVSDITYSDDIGQSLGFIKNAPSGGTSSIEMQKRYIHRNGEVIWANVSSSLITDSERRPQYFITYILNITARKEAEESLRKSEEKFFKIFRASPVPMSISTLADGKYIDVNESFLKHMEFQRDEVIGKSALELQTWANEKERNQVVSSMRDRGSIRDFEGKYRTKTGRIGTSIVSTEVIQLEGRDCILGVTLDITERKKSEEALRKSEERFQKIFQASPSRISISTLTEGRFIDVNESFLRYMEINRDEVIGKTVHELGIWAEGEDREQMVKLVRERGSVREFEVHYRTRSGKIGYSLASAEKIELEGIECMLTVALDMTDRKLAENALKTSMEQLHNLAARMENIREEERKLVSREVHDQLGQLLTALHMDLMSLGKHEPGSAELLETRIQSMLDLTSSATRTVQEISARLRPGMLDDLGLVAAIEWQTEDFRRRSGIECDLDLPDQDLNIDNAEATALFRILQETLTNVARHARARRVKVKLSESGGEVFLSVRDDGIGIKQKEIDSTKSFGLLGIRERLRPFDGTFIIRNPEGGGTEVLVHLRGQSSAGVKS